MVSPTVPSLALIEARVLDESPEPWRLLELLGRQGGAAAAPENWSPDGLPAWPAILRDGLRHQPYVLWAVDGERLVG